MKTKVCSNSQCESGGALLPLSAFHKCAQHSDGLRSECKECHNRQIHERYKNDPARRAAYAVQRGWQHRWYKLWVLTILGGCCSKCGTTEKPEIHHIDGDGAKHRAQHRTSGGRLNRRFYYRSMLIDGCIGLKLLCHDCHAHIRASGRDRQT
jgi:hypothetical protein